MLNGSREYGKQNLFDGAAETCWNSEQGTPQFIQISFLQPVHLQSVSFTFQGGFVGTSVQLSATTAVSSPKKFVPLARWEPRDCNDVQSFAVAPADADTARWVTNIKLTFPASTDFYGRITVYALDLQGQVEQGEPSQQQ